MSRLLTVENVSSGYGMTPVLRNVSLHVDTGEVVSVVGANGAGKSTLLRTITGLVHPTAGTSSSMACASPECRRTAS